MLAGKRLELLKETVPNFSRVGSIVGGRKIRDPNEPWEKESRSSARNLGLKIHSIEVREPGQVRERVSSVATKNAQRRL